MLSIKKTIFIFALPFLAASVFAQNTRRTQPAPNPLEVPYISTYMAPHMITPEENLEIKFYITDWNQSEYRLNDKSFRFQVILEYGIEGKGGKPTKIVKKDLPAGDHSIQLGKLRPGEYWFSLQTIDMHGRPSHVLFNEFIVREAAKTEITKRQTYYMTADDLKKYNIKNDGNYGEIELVDLMEEAGITARELSSSPGVSQYSLVADRFRKTKAEPGRYKIVAVGENGNPIMGNSRNCRIVYGEGYDRAAIELEAVATANGINQFLADSAKKYRKVVMLPGTYRISNTVTIDIPSEFTLDLNGAIIKMHEFTGHGGVMIRIRDCFDSHVVNGIVEGDYFEHDYKNSENNSEWVCGIDISGDSRYCSFEDMEVRYITGYGVINGFGGHGPGAPGVGGYARGMVDRKTGRINDMDGVFTSTFIDIRPFVPGKYLAVSRYLGYQGLSGTSWQYTANFYTETQSFIGTVDAFQYRLVRIPDKAVYMRVSVRGDDPEKLEDLTVNHMKVPYNCVFRNLKINLARCVGMAQAAMRNFLVEGCEFMYCAETGSFCAYDAEDGWDMMQDLTFRNNKFYTNARNDFLTCAGHNFVIEGNTGRIHLYARTNSYVVRNNTFRDGFFGSDGRTRSMMNRIENNTFTGHVTLGGGRGHDGWTTVMQGPIQAPSFSCTAGGMIGNAEIRDVKLNSLSALNCTIENVDLNFTGGTFINSKLKDVRGHSNGKVTIVNCDVENVTSAIFSPADITVKGSRLKNFQYAFAHWTKPSKLLIENCIVENDNLPLVRTPAYSIEDFTIAANQIKVGDSPVIDIYDLRPQKETDAEPGSVTISKNTVESASLLLKIGKGDSTKELSFFIDRLNKLNSGIGVLEQDAFPGTWKLNPKK